MRFTIGVFGLLPLLASCSSAPRELATATVQVEGYSCGSCDGYVKVALARVTGVGSHEKAMAAGGRASVRVQYDPGRATPDRICAAIDGAAPRFHASFIATEAKGPDFITRFKVADLYCEGCAESIKKELLARQGVSRVEARHVSGRQGEVAVTYRAGSVTEGDLRRAIDAVTVSFKASAGP